MKVTAFIGSGRKRHSYNACEKFLQNLQTMGNVEYEMVRLSEYNIGTCRVAGSASTRGGILSP